MDPVVCIINFFLVLARLSGIFILSPVLSSPNLPEIIKPWILFPIALIVYLNLPYQSFVTTTEEVALLLMVMKEAMIGILIGFCVAIVIEVLTFAGEIVSTPMGLSIAQAIDPASQETSTTLGQFNTTLATLLFLCLNFHHLIFEAWMASYTLIPIGQALMPDEAGIAWFTAKFYNIFMLSLQIAIPLLTVLILINFALGVLTRTLPKLNIFMVGIPLQIVLGMTTYVVTISFLSHAIQKLFTRSMTDISEAIRLFMP